jgi:hypothetical protein
MTGYQRVSSLGRGIVGLSIRSACEKGGLNSEEESAESAGGPLEATVHRSFPIQ